MKRLFLILSSIVLLASIFGVVSAFSLPSEIETQIPVLDYEHEGRFDYLVYPSLPTCSVPSLRSYRQTQIPC